MADRILFVDDDPDMGLLLEGVLRQAGFETVCVDSSRRALELLDQQQFDLLLTDKNMADLDGHALIREATARQPTIGAAIISGHRSHEGAALPPGLRILAYFEKPIYDLRQVALTLRQVLQQHRNRLSTNA